MAMYFQELFFHSTIECFRCLNCGDQRDPKIIKPRLFILKTHLANSTFRAFSILLCFWLVTVYLDSTVHSNVLYMCWCAFKFLKFYLWEIFETKVEVNFSRHDFHLLLPSNWIFFLPRTILNKLLGLRFWRDTNTLWFLAPNLFEVRVIIINPQKISSTIYPPQPKAKTILVCGFLSFLIHPPRSTLFREGGCLCFMRVTPHLV